MKFEWDENKRKSNYEKHGLDFRDVELCFESLIFEWEDTRFDYGEKRFVSLALLDSRVVSLVYVKKAEDLYRIISFRKANERETKSYLQRFEEDRQHDG